jgi:hypothetical protein
MVHIPFDTRSVSYDSHYHTSGKGIESVEGTGPISEPYHYYRGLEPFQRGFGGRQTGAGIGNVLRGLWRFLLPVLKRAGTAVARETLDTGERIMQKLGEKGDDQQQQPLKEVIISEGKKGADKLLQRAGLAKQFGTGGRRKAIKRLRNARTPSFIPSHQTIVGRSILKLLPTKLNPLSAKRRRRQRSDTFGLY